MRYITYAEFSALYADAISLTDFDRIEYDAEAILDNWVLTVDGVNKLRVAFPTTYPDVEAVKRCICALTMACKDIEDAERLSMSEHGLVSSVSSGTESMTFARGNSALARAVADDESKARYLGNIVKRYLAGKKDANGVNLLYGGAYPYVIKDGVSSVC